MAQQSSLLDRDRYCCSICLDLLCDPGTLACGHSYCLDCITYYWDNEKDIYSCPQCRHVFEPRPALVKNTVLADVMEDLKRTRLRDPPPDHCYAGPEDLGCDLCAGRKMKAIKSCLGCQASFCEDHLQSHYQVPGLKRHMLVEPTADLQDNICPRHDEVIRMFCCQDQQSICCVCAVGEHKGHEMISVEAERNKRQEDLSSQQTTTRTRIQKGWEDLKVLHHKMDAINQSADETLSDVDEAFAEMIRPLESQRLDIKEMIRTNQQAALSWLKDLHTDLEWEIVNMKRSEADLKHLSHIQSHVTFLQNYPQNVHLKEHNGLTTRDIPPMLVLENVTGAFAEMTDKLNKFIIDNISQISLALAQADDLPSPHPEPQTRADFLQYACEITFDPSTKTESLSLCEDNRRMTLSVPKQQETVGNCLSQEGLTGRKYWEVKWTGHYVSIAVGYKDSSWNRTGFGNDDKSWSLTICQIGTEFEHNRIITKIPGRRPSRLGVYLDYSAGTLCFYSISDTMTLLHEVQTRFTQPLHTGIWLYERPGVFAEFCYPLQL